MMSTTIAKIVSLTKGGSVVRGAGEFLCTLTAHDGRLESPALVTLIVV